MSIHESAIVSPGAILDPSVVVWQGTSVREGATIGAGTSIGQYSYIGPGVRIGANCKIQNGAYLYEPAIIEAAVFLGPRVVLTNDRAPRAVTPTGAPKSAADWTPVGVVIRHGASIGAAAVCVAPLTIGAWAMVAAGAVVTRDVPPYALVVGVPARRVGWVGPAGVALIGLGSTWHCPVTGEQFDEIGPEEIVAHSTIS
jgi:acetyltransferase-like isoleucine patch superfamily enzyme